MGTLPLVLMVLGLVLFLISTFWQPNPPAPASRPFPFPNFISLGLFCWILAEIILKQSH